MPEKKVVHCPDGERRNPNTGRCSKQCWKCFKIEKTDTSQRSKTKKTQKKSPKKSRKMKATVKFKTPGMMISPTKIFSDDDVDEAKAYLKMRGFKGSPGEELEDETMEQAEKREAKEAKDAEKAAAKAVKDAEKAAAKVVKDAEKAAAKAVKDAEKAAAKKAKEAEKAKKKKEADKTKKKKKKEAEKAKKKKEADKTKKKKEAEKAKKMTLKKSPKKMTLKKSPKKMTLKKSPKKMTLKNPRVYAFASPSSNKKLKLYSPSINKKLKSLKSPSPLAVQGCPEDTIMVKEKNGTTKCYGWTSKKAQIVMLNNLISKKPIDCKTVTAPKQLQTNCWFNSFFIIFFISDMGRKFNRWLREAMITGKLADGRSVEKSLKKPLFLLNKYINASLRSSYDNTNFADLMDTNKIIHMIYSKVGKKNRSFSPVGWKWRAEFVNVSEHSNPLDFYASLYNMLGGDLMTWIKLTIEDGWINIKDGVPTLIQQANGKIPKVVYLEVMKTQSKDFHKPTQFTQTIWERATPGNPATAYKCTYKLDSAVLMNTKQFHFSAYITCNGKEFSFDGASYSRMKEFAWKRNINKNFKWSLTVPLRGRDPVYFNFTDGYQILTYYLTKKMKI